ncbi:MAG: hypothetical protein ACRDT0_08965 [Pseudonocardiaceae bacterium]
MSGWGSVDELPLSFARRPAAAELLEAVNVLRGLNAALRRPDQLCPSSTRFRPPGGTRCASTSTASWGSGPLSAEDLPTEVAELRDELTALAALRPGRVGARRIDAKLAQLGPTSHRQLRQPPPHREGATARPRPDHPVS